MDRPLLVFDGKCGFCRLWIDYWKRLTGDAIDYAPYQEIAGSFPQIPVEHFQQAVQLILPSGEVHAGAHAVFETLAIPRKRHWLLSAYKRLPGVKPFTDAAYRFIARHRDLGYRLTVLLFGRDIRPLSYHAVQWLFLKLLALTYLIAFASLGMQAAGLIGSHGVEPASQYLSRIAVMLPQRAYLAVPTLLWLNSSDAAIHAVCVTGCIAALFILFGFLWRAALAVAFVLYLSLVSASQVFLSYQWDYLLLETGFLAIFLGYSRATVWLFRWLLFRLMFFSGVVKLASGDPSWRGLTALTFHYQTQPIPTPLAWYAQQLPVWFQKLSCLGVFFAELVVPFLVFAPRRLRHLAAFFLIGLQLLIAFTGNYAFFNLLAICLCLFLFDDPALSRFLPERAFRLPRLWTPPLLRKGITWVLVACIGVLSGLTAISQLSHDLPAAGQSLLDFVGPFGVVNSYGLFAVMTTTRPEIIIEGSEDGATWLDYEFKYKAGRLDRRPPWVAPYQPRLDWQMWFAALGSYRGNLWFLNMVARLLQGRPEVLDLLDKNPFPGHPPTLIRARVYEYHFTGWRSRDATGDYWTRELAGTYLPPVDLKALSKLPLLEAAE